MLDLLYPPGLIALAVGLPLGLVWLGAPVAARFVPSLRLSASSDRFLGRCAGMLVVGGGIALAIGLEPSIRPQRFLPTVERNAAPIVEAIERHVAEHGAPPADASALIPRYLAAWPATAYRDRGFAYAREERRGGAPNAWSLCVRTANAFDLADDSALVFSSASRRWSYVAD